MQKVSQIMKKCINKKSKSYEETLCKYRYQLNTKKKLSHSTEGQRAVGETNIFQGIPEPTATFSKC